MNYWLMKSEPDVYSIDDLKARGSDPWEGVRNYQARNFMRDDMRKGDKVLFYHSNTKVPGIVGLATVSREAYPDHFSWDPDSDYYDPKSSAEKPRWFMVDVAYERHLKRKIPLAEIKQKADDFEGLALIRRGNRLSVMPVNKSHYQQIIAMEKQPNHD